MTAAFQQLVQSDPVVAPLATLQMIAFRAASAAHWAEGLPPLQRPSDAPDQPLLHGARLAVRAGEVRQLLLEMSQSAARLDALVLLKASLEANSEQLERLAAETEVEVGLLATLAHLALLPLLLACGWQALPLPWQQGYCPLCAAWPTLAELRGLERRRWLRCGRCASAWSYPGQQCPYCTNRDHRSLGYLAPEGAHESQQASTCEQCHGYLKAVATMGALSGEEIALKDLTTLELDLVALEQGYTRPTQLGFPLRVQIEAIEAKGGWLRWRR